MKNSIWRKSSYRQSKKKKLAWDSSSTQGNAGFFKQLDFRQIEFFNETQFFLKKIEFQNRGISVNNFRNGVFCWKVWLKRVKPNFGPIACFVFAY